MRWQVVCLSGVSKEESVSCLFELLAEFSSLQLPAIG